MQAVFLDLVQDSFLKTQGKINIQSIPHKKIYIFYWFPAATPSPTTPTPTIVAPCTLETGNGIGWLCLFPARHILKHFKGMETLEC